MRRAGGGASPSLSSAVLHVFNLNQNQARLPGVGDRLQRFFTLYRINKLLLFFFFSFFFPVKEKLIVLFSFKARTEFYGRIFSRHPRGIELSSFFLPPLFLTKYVLDFYCLLGFFPHAHRPLCSVGSFFVFPLDLSPVMGMVCASPSVKICAKYSIRRHLLFL